MQSGLYSFEPHSYPISGAAAGIDLTSDEIIELANHPNCFGVKVRRFTLPSYSLKSDFFFFLLAHLRYDR